MGDARKTLAEALKRLYGLSGRSWDDDQEPQGDVRIRVDGHHQATGERVLIVTREEYDDLLREMIDRLTENCPDDYLFRLIDKNEGPRT